jgi:hypothetical protein
MGAASSDICVGVGRLNEIKAARPTAANLLSSTPHGLERAGRTKARGTQPHLLALTAS